MNTEEKIIQNIKTNEFDRVPINRKYNVKNYAKLSNENLDFLKIECIKNIEKHINNRIENIKFFEENKNYTQKTIPKSVKQNNIIELF